MTFTLFLIYCSSRLFVHNLWTRTQCKDNYMNMNKLHVAKWIKLLHFSKYLMQNIILNFNSSSFDVEKIKWCFQHDFYLINSMGEGEGWILSRHVRFRDSCCNKWQSSLVEWTTTGFGLSPLQRCKPVWGPQWPWA